MASCSLGLYLTPPSGSFLSFSFSAIPGPCVGCSLPSTSISFFRMAVIFVFVTDGHWGGLFLLRYSFSPGFVPRVSSLPFSSYSCVSSVFRSRFIQPCSARGLPAQNTCCRGFLVLLGAAPGLRATPPSSPPPFPLRGCLLGGRAILFVLLPLERLRLD